jgi:putative transposase
MIELARQYGRYGYRRIAALLRDAGWHVNDKRVERLWRREGLKVPMKQPKKGRLWLNDGSCVRLQPEHRDHVWSYDFVHCRTDDGKAFRTLNIVDEYSRECLAIRVDRKLNSGNVIDALSDLFILRGIPSFIRSDNGPEFVAQAVRDWIEAVGAKTAYIEPGSPWENGYCESFNARFRDEFLNGEIFYSLREAQILIEEWRKHYNTKRPHSALGYRPPAPETIAQMDQRPIRITGTGSRGAVPKAWGPASGHAARAEADRGWSGCHGEYEADRPTRRASRAGMEWPDLPGRGAGEGLRMDGRAWPRSRRSQSTSRARRGPARASSGCRIAQGDLMKKIRCAIYTRKSSEDGLEQEFNSLHAQREACAAYIASQKHEGWVMLPDAYDDGGLSGGSLERPALQHLLDDVRSGRVDQIVVYKIDRLTRSLSDFAKIVDVLDAAGASFVSVTQSFNTATSMGRLTLNMLCPSRSSSGRSRRSASGTRSRRPSARGSGWAARCRWDTIPMGGR